MSKKNLFSFMVISLIAVMFSLSSCDKKEDNANPFVGTWEGSIVGMDDVNVKMVFTEDTFTSTVSGKLAGQTLNETTKGTYSYENDTITTVIDGKTNNMKYTIVGNKLTINGTYNNMPVQLTLTKK